MGRIFHESDSILKLYIKFAGGFAGVMAWLISYPADVVKSRLQAQDGFDIISNHITHKI